MLPGRRPPGDAVSPPQVIVRDHRNVGLCLLCPHHLHHRVQNSRGWGARDLDPEEWGVSDPALPGAYALWACSCRSSV